MAIAPVTQSSVSRLTIQRANASSSIASVPMAPQRSLTRASSSDLNQQLKNLKEQSLEYQLIRELLMHKKRENAPSAPHKPAINSQTEGQPSDAEDTDSSNGSVVDSDAAQTHLSPATDTLTAIHLTSTEQTLSVQIDGQTPAPVQKADPLVLDIDGNGIQTTGIDAGASLDINADGSTDKTSVAAGADALLALDLNHNGQIDTGKELFGDQSGDANGFAALRRYDSNQDQKIDHSDAIFNALQLLRFDAKGRQYLQTLAQAGIREIDLNNKDIQVQTAQGDQLTQTASYIGNDGHYGTIADAQLQFRNQS